MLASSVLLAAKAGMIDLGVTLTMAALKYNIWTNIIAPVASSRTTATGSTSASHYSLVTVLTHQSDTSKNGSISRSVKEIFRRFDRRG